MEKLPNINGADSLPNEDFEKEGLQKVQEDYSRQEQEAVGEKVAKTVLLHTEEDPSYIEEFPDIEEDPSYTKHITHVTRLIYEIPKIAEKGDDIRDSILDVYRSGKGLDEKSKNDFGKITHQMLGKMMDEIGEYVYDVDDDLEDLKSIIESSITYQDLDLLKKATKLTVRQAYRDGEEAVFSDEELLRAIYSIEINDEENKKKIYGQRKPKQSLFEDLETLEEIFDRSSLVDLMHDYLFTVNIEEVNRLREIGWTDFGIAYASRSYDRILFANDDGTAEWWDAIDKEKGHDPAAGLKIPDIFNAMRADREYERKKNDEKWERIVWGRG